MVSILPEQASRAPTFYQINVKEARIFKENPHILPHMNRQKHAPRQPLWRGARSAMKILISGNISAKKPLPP